MNPRRKSILFAWEWGAGVGHLRPFAPLAARVQSAGHRVTVVVRDLTNVRRFFCRDKFEVRQAPCNTANIAGTVRDPTTFAGIAWNLGYDNPVRVAGLIEAWRGVIDDVRPDLVVCEFGLTASIVSHVLGLPRLALGTGFTCPPPTHPLSSLKEGQQEAQVEAKAKSVEARVLQNINWGLRKNGLPAIHSVADAICRPEETLLATVAEFDHYARRPGNPEYLGVWSRSEGETPLWHGQTGCKAVAYLKPFKNFRRLHEAFASQGVDVALVADGVPESMLAGPEPPAMRLQRGLVDLERAAPECRFGITNGNHATTLRMLALGLPVLVCPLFIEQRYTAERVCRLGMGVRVDPSKPANYASAIEGIRTSSECRSAALAFAARYQQAFAEAETRAAERFFEAIERS